MKLLNPNYRKDKAQGLFLEGYNCSQSVVLSFSDILNIDKDSLAKITSSFGGGIGRLRETCGAISGACVVLGLLYGYETPETGEIKKEHYSRIQEIVKEFKKEFKTIICRELLGNCVDNSPNPSPRTKEYYETRPCKKIAGYMAFLISEYINSHHLD